MQYIRAALALLSTLFVAPEADVGLAGPAGDKAPERSSAACWSDAVRASPHAGGTLVNVESGAEAGTFRLLTYNVAGLPDFISPSHPAVNIALISPLLNRFDVVLVQEDFAYHSRLSGQARHAFRSEPMSSSLALMADGLSLFSQFVLGKTHRVRWTRCSGYLSDASDCLADKGFSFAEITLSPGVVIDAYNLHADAGGGLTDRQARRANFEQLAAYIRERPQTHAVIVAGDTNLGWTRAEDVATFRDFVHAAQLTDACRAVQCNAEGIDRVLYRDSADIRLQVLDWWHDAKFVDGRGAPLSDHPAVGVELAWHRSRSLPGRVATRLRAEKQ